MPELWKKFKEIVTRRKSNPSKDPRVGARVGAAVAHGTAYDSSFPELEVVSDLQMIKEYFFRLRDGFTKQVHPKGKLTPNFRFEYGNLPGDRAYFFAAEWDEDGWLFEISPTGWVISRANKIVQSHTFLRSSLPVDKVVLFQTANADGKAKKTCLRLASTMYGKEFMTFPIYEANLRRSLNIF